MNVQINRSELVTRFLEVPAQKERERRTGRPASTRPAVNDLARIRQEAITQWNWEWVSWASLGGSAFTLLVLAFWG